MKNTEYGDIWTEISAVLLNTIAFLIVAFLAFCIFIMVREYFLKIKKIIKKDKGNAKIEVMENTEIDTTETASTINDPRSDDLRNRK